MSSIAFPMPMWVTPHAQRRDRIQTLWQQAWPDGHWLITTEADLLHDRWLDYQHGRLRERHLFEFVGDQERSSE